jgi:DNA-binding protein YbaB
MVLAAVQDAMQQATKLSEEKMGALTGGMRIPGLM